MLLGLYELLSIFELTIKTKYIWNNNIDKNDQREAETLRLQFKLVITEQMYKNLII